jgi:tetratricopeptide (TPR) repeat protein
MKLLQSRLAGKDVTVLYRDPAEQRDRFAAALGRRLGAVTLWELPARVEIRLFTDPQFVEATKAAMELFRPELPLIYARMKHLRGEVPDAIEAYVAFRFAENAMLVDQKAPIPAEVQKALDVYATYYLGMCHLDQKHDAQAEFFFEKTLELLPEPGPRRPYFYMFRWGAQANLARLKEAGGDYPKATAYYSLKDPTPQRQGNLLRARDLVWRDPTAPVPGPLPPAPPEAPAPEAAANAR